MHPLKTPNWIKWIISPKYCFAVLRLRYQRATKTKEGRKKIWRKIWLFFKRNALVGSVILLTFQITNERSWRREAELKVAEVQKENSFIRGVVTMRNSDMRDFPFPWWQKKKFNNDYRFLDLNKAYENTFGYQKVESIGKSNVEFFGDLIGAAYRKNDSLVVTDWKNIITIEPSYYKNEDRDGLYKNVLVIKYPERTRQGDSIASGMTIPLGEVIEILDSTGKYEVIQINQAPNEMQDSITINN